MTFHEIINYAKNFGVDFDNDVMIDGNKLVFMRDAGETEDGEDLGKEVSITIELETY